VIRNVFPLQSRARPDLGPVGEPPALIWFSQTIGPGRGLEEFFAAWARTQAPSRIFLLGDLRVGYAASLLASLDPAKRLCVTFLPPVTPGQLPARLTDFDVGLALELSSPVNRNLTATNKLFQYFNAGLAVIASDTQGQSEILRTAPDSGLLLRSADATAFARELDALFLQPARLRGMQLASRRAATERFCWEHEERRLRSAVDDALARPAPSAA
jgi:glycosyltransferase involved in cell wall biosynthesis